MKEVIWGPCITDLTMRNLSHGSHFTVTTHALGLLGISRKMQKRREMRVVVSKVHTTRKHRSVRVLWFAERVSKAEVISYAIKWRITLR